MAENIPSHILVVDDEPDLEILMKQRMRREVRRGELVLSFAQNGSQALEMLRGNNEIQIVLSDINMPVMDGLTMLEKIPSINDKIKTVMISAYGDMKNIRHAMNQGAFDFITKPVDFEDLKITINRTNRRVAFEHELHENREKLISIQSELATASAMQQSILPRIFPIGDNFQIDASMDAAREIGGDFYDVVKRRGSQIGLCIADVSGKGIPAALFMMSSRTLLNGASIGMEEPEKVLREVNDLLEKSNESMMFVTLFYAVFDSDTRHIHYSNGGHNQPIVFRADGSVYELETSRGVALGVARGIEFESSSLELQPGEVLVLYTDGVNEAERGDGSFFGMERLMQAFDGKPPPKNAKQVTETIFAKVREFTDGNEQSDDITCLVLCVS